MKKRLFALMLVLAMVLGMNTVAFAEENVTDFTKKYVNEEGKEITTPVAETIEFDVVCDKEDEGAPDLAVADFPVDEALESIPFTVTRDDDTEVGEYVYTITEKEGATAGVEYGKQAIKVVVVVSEDAQGEPTVFDVQLKLEDNKKEDTITNTYKTGEFTVAKAVQGDLSKKTDKFDIIVTLTSQKKVAADIKIGDATIASGEWKGTGPYTYTHTIDDITANTTAVTFSNIPYDVVVTVKESAEQMNGYTRVDTFNSLTVNENLNDGNNDIVVINEKNSEILTGIIVNNMPYIVALVVLVAAAVVFFRRRREF